MRSKRTVRRICQGVSVLVAGAVGLGMLATARAEDPMLTVVRHGAPSGTYLLPDIRQVRFAGNELQVVDAAGATRSYPLSSIARIEFLMEWAGVREPRATPLPAEATHLFQNRPNPCSSRTRIAFELPASGQADVRIHSLEGRLVRRLVAGRLPAGRHEVDWDGRDERGQIASSGVYFYDLTAPGIAESRVLMFMP